MTTRFNPYRLFTGSWIPEWLLERTEISPGAKLCYARLARFAGRDGNCHPFQSTIAKALGCSERQIRRYTDELVDCLLIEEERRGMGQPNRYHFLKHLWMLATVETDRTDVSAKTGQICPDYKEESHLSDNISPSSEGDTRARAKAKVSKKLAKRLPEDFVPPDEWRDYALRYEFTEAAAGKMWLNFRDHHKAKGTRFVDWDAAWQKWVRKEIEIQNDKQSRRKP